MWIEWFRLGRRLQLPMYVSASFRTHFNVCDLIAVFNCVFTFESNSRSRWILTLRLHYFKTVFLMWRETTLAIDMTLLQLSPFDRKWLRLMTILYLHTYFCLIFLCGHLILVPKYCIIVIIVVVVAHDLASIVSLWLKNGCYLWPLCIWIPYSVSLIIWTLNTGSQILYKYYYSYYIIIYYYYYLLLFIIYYNYYYCRVSCHISWRRSSHISTVAGTNRLQKLGANFSCF